MDDNEINKYEKLAGEPHKMDIEMQVGELQAAMYECCQEIRRLKGALARATFNYADYD